ncbi:CASP-like protein 4B3 [Aegilops tauschii subsp. strangulata]|uniref:CASP-like protein 4B3 n=1 Tax=Aegilops tauschii subsp. strangulata TaxID=200361 RepID=UPI00098B34E8|nr:CASP-like protein 4B3 [Aegilops tauschii subsp. strangulata]XP_044399890.1 CASP-like protein 4B3 [Triticum aestivum]
MSSASASSEPHDAPAADSSVPASRSIAERWKMEAAPVRARLLLRAFAWLFSLLALVVMATDVHGRGGAQDFSTYPEYNYCLGMSIIALLYATAQLLRDAHRLSSGRDLVAGRKAAAVLDFAGDQVVAYSLISGLSAAAPVTDYMRQAADNLFNDSAAAAISLAFFAFLAIGLSALISGYNLSLEALV